MLSRVNARFPRRKCQSQLQENHVDAEKKINKKQKQKRQGTTKAGASASTNTVPVWAHAVVVDGAKTNNVGETKASSGQKM